jgi:hypothetical protein
MRRMALVIPALLVLTGGALAASGVIEIGAPAERAGGPFSFSTVRGGGIATGSERLLALSVPDPAGGPAWGMRVFSTKQGEGCLQVGRLLDGKLGAIGQDDAFGDDGRFHAFAQSSAFAKRACTVLDGAQRLFVNATVGDMPASAWVGYGGGCVPSTASHAERFQENGKPRALCPQADERNLYYGLLGPDAQSITYVLDGHAHTQPTVGPEGAYLLATAPTEPAPTAAQVSAHVHARLVTNRHGEHEIALSFTAPVAATSARRAYSVKWRSPETPPKAYGSAALEPRTPAAGQTVTAMLGRGGPSWLGHGEVTGEVIFQDATGPGGLEEGPGTVERVVGAFSVNVP